MTNRVVQLVWLVMLIGHGNLIHTQITTWRFCVNVLHCRSQLYIRLGCPIPTQFSHGLVGDAFRMTTLLLKITFNILFYMMWQWRVGPNVVIFAHNNPFCIYIYSVPFFGCKPIWIACSQYRMLYYIKVYCDLEWRETDPMNLTHIWRSQSKIKSWIRLATHFVVMRSWRLNICRMIHLISVILFKITADFDLLHCNLSVR